MKKNYNFDDYNFLFIDNPMKNNLRNTIILKNKNFNQLIYLHFVITQMQLLVKILYITLLQNIMEQKLVFSFKIEISMKYPLKC